MLRAAWSHAWKTLRAGFFFALPLIVIFVILKMIWPMAAVLRPSHPWGGVLILFGAFYVLGLVSSQVALGGYLKEHFPFPVVEWFVDLVFSQSESEEGREVFFYPDPRDRSWRVRGVIKSESPDKKYWVVHFACPPTPMTGLTLIEVEKDSPRLEETGRGAASYHFYTMTFGKK